MFQIRFLDCILVYILTLALAAVTVGCAALPERPGEPLRMQGSPQPLHPGDIVATRSGKVIFFAELMAELSAQRVIYVGETHTSTADHQVQQQVLEALYNGNHDLALAMEMFPRQSQPTLDQWSKGSVGEDVFLREANWSRVWGYPFSFYRGLLDFCRDHRLKVIGLNAPPEVVKAISSQGLAHLDPRDRAQLARDFDFTDSAHRRYLEEEYDQHVPGNIKNFETFYEAQLAWEETMAETLAAELADPDGSRQVLVVVGNGHIVYRFGIPQRAYNRVPHPYQTIVTVPANTAERELDPELADYIWVTAPLAVHHAQRGRLGILIERVEASGELKIREVIPGSPAAQAGLRSGDILLGIDDQPIVDVHDIRRSIVESEHDPTHRLTIRRDDIEQSITVHIPRDEW